MDLAQTAALIPIVSGSIQQLLEAFGNPLYTWYSKRGTVDAPTQHPAAPAVDVLDKASFMAIAGLVLGVLASPAVFPHGLSGGLAISDPLWWCQVIVAGPLLGAGANVANSLAKYVQSVKTVSAVNASDTVQNFHNVNSSIRNLQSLDAEVQNSSVRVPEAPLLVTPPSKEVHT